jgi:phosphoglycerate kinase
MNFLKDAKIEDKTVFLRVDWNVPLKNGEIANDSRIRATVPTIEFLRSKNCKIIIGTHLGRPDGDIVPSLSTRILAKGLSLLVEGKIFATDYIIESAVKQQIGKLKPKEILVIGNLRWYGEEETNNRAFANLLASYADAYVNDAFAVSHRAHASVEAITRFLPSYAGFLLEKEITSLTVLTESPRHPFVLVLGGAKIKDKISLIKKFSPIVDNFLIGGGIGNTLHFFKGDKISRSFYEPNLESSVVEILEIAGNKMIIPLDSEKKDMGNGDFSILDIGPKTIAKFKEIIAGAKTICWNGNIGFSEDEKYAKGTLEIAKAIKENKYVRVVAGGDTVGFLDSHDLVDGYTFVSTGGGAALEFLAGIELPGLKALGYYKK